MGTIDPQRVIAIGHELEQIGQQRRQLAQREAALLAEVAAMTSGPTSAQKSNGAPAVAPNGDPAPVTGPAAGFTQKELVVLALVEAGRALHKQEIAAKTGLSIDQVTFRLVDLKRKDEFVETQGKGMWTLSRAGQVAGAAMRKRKEAAAM